MSPRQALAGLLLALSLTLASMAGASPTDWPMVRQGPQGQGVVRLPGIDPAGLSGWTFQASSHVWSYKPGMSVWSTAAVGQVRGRPVVLVGSYDNNVYCLDALSGKKLWRYTTGGGVYAAPALWAGPGGGGPQGAHQGAKEAASTGPLVFVASSDRLVYALDADLGRRKWVHAIKTWRPTMGGARLSAPAVGRAKERHAVFVGHWVWDKSLSGHLQAGGITALDALTGKHLWTTSLGDNEVSSPVYAVLPGPAGARIFVGSENGNLYALDAASGRKVWTYSDREAIKGSPAVFTTPLGPRVVFGSKYGRVRCLDALSGLEVWRYNTGHWVDSSPAVARVGDRDLVLVGSYSTMLYALDALAGFLVWSHRTAGGIYSSPAVVRDRDGVTKVLFSSWDHHLYCLRAQDGSLLWSAFFGSPLWDSITLGDSTWSSPSVALLGGRAVAFQGFYSGPFHAVVLDEAQGRALSRSGSNLHFWLMMPLVMLAAAALTILLTRRYRATVGCRSGHETP